MASTMSNAAPEKRREENREERREDTQGADAQSVPVWARGVKGAKPAQVVEGVAAIVSAIRRTPTKPAKTTAAPVLSLWRALDETQTWDAFVRDALLVADAVHDSPDRLFARDVRAEDWEKGTDRRRDVSTVCTQARWQVRLDTARAWDAAGRPAASQGAPLLANGKVDLKNAHKVWEGKTDDDLRAEGWEVF